MTEVWVGYLAQPEINNTDFALISIKNAAVTNVHGGPKYVQVALSIEAAIDLSSKLSKFLTDHSFVYCAPDRKPIFIAVNPADYQQ